MPNYSYRRTLATIFERTMKGLSLLIIIILISCNTKDNNSYFNTIQGDWISDTNTRNWRNNNLIFSFEDTLCAYLYAWGKNTTFKIENDILQVKEVILDTREDSKNGQTYSFRILKLIDDILQITPITEETNQLFDRNEIGDTITFSKVQQKNSIVPSKISFFTSRCYGTCPSFFMEIDSSGYVKYYGHDYTDVLGGAKGRITHRDYKIILSKIHNVLIDSIKTVYEAGYTDSQTCLIVIDYNSKSMESKVYGYDKEPIELRILFHSLFAVTSSLNLVRDSTITVSDFYHFPVFKKFFPPPPPPIKTKFKFTPPQTEE